MKIHLLVVIASLGICGCDNAQTGGTAESESLLGSCAFNVESSLGMLYSLNNQGQQPSALMQARIKQVGKNQCDCAKRSLQAADYAAFNPEVSASQQDQGKTMVSVRQSETTVAELRDRINGVLQASCPAEAL